MHISFAIVFIWCLSILILVKLFGKKSIFSITILSWYLMWYLIDSFELTGLYHLSNLVNRVVFVFFFSFLFGAISTVFINYKNKPFYFDFSLVSNFPKKYYRIIRGLSVYIVTPLYMFFMCRGFYLLATEFTISQYRSDVFGLLTGTSTLFFNSSLINMVYTFVLLPYLFYILFLGFGYCVRYRKFGLLFVSVLLIIMDSLMMAGRFGFHYVLFAFLLIFLFRINIQFFSINSKFILTIFFLLVFSVSSVYFISEGRAIKGRSKAGHLIEHFVIDYHTESFHILDFELNNPKSLIYDHTYGLSTISAFERYFLLVTNRLGLTSKNSEADLIGGYLHESRNIGIDSYGQPKFYNAFATSLFVLYRDGDLLGVILGGLIFGFLLQYWSNTFNRFVFSSTLMVSSLSYLGIYSLFQCVITGPMMIAFFLCILTVYFLRLKKNSIHLY